MKLIRRVIAEYIRETDKFLWALCILVSGISVLLLYGALESGYEALLDISYRNLFVQCAAIGLGLLCVLILSKIDYHFMRKMWMIHVPATYLLVLLTFFIGTGAAARPDDKRWLILPFVDVWLQPSELLKISFILIFAYHIIQCGDSLNKLVNILFLCAHAALPVVLIHFQGDDGTALLIATIAVTMLCLAGLNWKYIVLGIAAIAALIPVGWLYVLSDFQKERIMVLINQAEADPLGPYYQQYWAKVAIAMGGTTGIGLLDVKHTYVPEMHTDFIFSFLCESFGFMGALGVLVVMLAMCLKMLNSSSRSKDTYGSLVCIGVFAMILFQFIINVGMCLSIVPVIGNTFPFLSYGGTSVITNYLGIGLVMSVFMHRKTGVV